MPTLRLLNGTAARPVIYWHARMTPPVAEKRSS
jgi:hypothetical protein